MHIHRRTLREREKYRNEWSRLTLTLVSNMEAGMKIPFVTKACINNLNHYAASVHECL